MTEAAQHAAHPGEEATLYVVATPIGNLRDITLRALDVLRSVAVIAAEDTRVTARLLNHHGIAGVRLMSVREHNEARAAPEILNLLEEGASVALVTDAGTPAISDPGAVLVAAVRRAGRRVVPIPGPNAATTALSASGWTGPYLFRGFLPPRAGERREALRALAAESAHLVFYEAPHRIVEMAADLREVLGADRRILFARELTKMFETLHETTLADAVAWLESDPVQQKGEFVVLVSGAAAAGEPDVDERVLKILLAELPLKQAVKLAAELTGGRRNAIYARALELDAPPAQK